MILNPKNNNGVYKEETANDGIEKREMPSEFKNKRVPLDGIELLLNREKVPDSLGKRMDKKNIKENSPKMESENPMSDLDDIISDAESLNAEDSSFKNQRLKKRFIKRREPQEFPKQDKDFFPSSKFPSSKPLQPPQPSQHVLPDIVDEPSDDVSEIISDGEHHKKDVVDDASSYSGESDYSKSSYTSSRSSRSNRSNRSVSETEPNNDSKWKSPSAMSKDEIVAEKMDLLYRYSRLDGNGYKSGLDLNMRTPLETLRSEVLKLERMRNVQRSIRTQRKLLISFASGTEYCNKKYNPYKFALDGWSGDILENIGDYDEVFEELHDKYKDSVQMSPELKLLTMVGGSGLMFHLSNTLFKSSTPQLNDILQSNPDIMAQIQKAALGSMANTNAGDPIFNMMMGGINERSQQREQQAPWDGRKGYAPPRTQGFPQASNSNSSVGAEVNQVPQGQGLYSQQAQMQGPQGFDDILNQLNANSMGTTGLISDVEEAEEPLKDVTTKQRKQRQQKPKKNKQVIDLDM